MTIETADVALRTGSSADWAAATGLILAAGELGLDTDTRDLRIGDGTTAWASLHNIGEVKAKGTAILVLGTKVVAQTAVKADSIILLTTQVLGTVAAPKPLCVSARVVDTSFTILSSDATDTSTVGYVIIEP